MRHITPHESEEIGASIFDQALHLDRMADAFVKPWGRASWKRLRRLAKQRLSASLSASAQILKEEGLL